MQLKVPAINSKFEKKNNLALLESIDLDCIPYACHYNEETILTKQGELLKIIKLEDYSSVDNYSDLRTEIRKSISKNINSLYFTVWIHTVRRRNKLSLKWNKTEDFSDKLHSARFDKLTDSKLQYINELYIVILFSDFGKHTNNSFFFNRIKNKHKLSLQESHQELQKITDLIQNDLEPFGAKKLGLRFSEGKIYSEMIEFLHYIVTLTHKDYPIHERDLSQYIRNFKIAFGFNTFQTIFENQQKFGSVFSIKEYREISLGNIDRCLQLESEFIITEIMIFTSNSKAIKEFNKQINMLQISEDNTLLKSSGIEEIIELEKTSSLDFCQQKIIFTIFADDRNKLAENISDLSSIMSLIGFMIFRTDLHMESHFWAQLPGNFTFITQPKNILAKYACSFAMLHDFTSGTLKGGRWKEAVTVFFSKEGNPYFFNFHGKRNNGHTTILGAPNSGRTSLINFLLSESRKFNPRIVILDNTGKSIIFTKAVSGKYYIIDPKYKDKSLKFNPLNIEDSASNRNMLVELIKRMVADMSLVDVEEKIRKIVDSIFAIPKESRSIAQISEVLLLLGGKISRWCDGGEFAYLFQDGNESDIDWETKIISLNTANLTKRKECMSVILYYFLYSFEAKCDGSPAILVLDEAWEISNIFPTEKEFDNWMQRMTELNVVVILSTENLNLAFASKFTQYLDKHVDTRILMPNVNANRLYMKAFSLSKEELNIILQTPTQEALILLVASNGYSDICKDIHFRTDAEATGSSIGKGLANFFTGKWDNLNFDPHLLKEIRVTAIKDQGIDGYFDPKIQVCDYEGGNCYVLANGTSCHQIYGTQKSGAGISAAVFIDWEGDTILDDGKIKEGIAKGLGWEWANDVTDEEKRKFANAPKICACSQKAACMGDFFSYFTKIGEGANIFSPGYTANTCDTCYQEKVKCAPVPLAPSPPPFCKQLAMSPPQVRIVPITDKDNDYFDPKVKVIAGDLIKEGEKIGKELDFPREYGKDKAKEHSILDRDGTTHYFKTYREKDKLCAKYRGTQSIDDLQFVRCFPAPPAPEPKILRIVDANTLEIEMKMSESTCIYRAHGVYSNGFCTFNVNTDHNHPVNIGPLSLKVVQPAIVAKTTDSNNEKSYIDNIIEGILESNPQQFKVLKEYGYVPDIETECKEFQGNKCKLNNLGQPEIEVKYKGNSNSKMLCLSGWQPEPEEFVLERDGKIIPLKSMGTRYTKYSAVYSKESNQFYYLPNKENKIDDPLNKDQDQLDKIIFNKQGYVFFPDENKQEKGKCSYCVKRNDEIDDAFKSNKGLKVVYKLTDVEHREKCNQGDDGCICFNGTCSRSTRYVDKENTQSFYTKISQDANGVVTQQEAPIKANRTEVFYADKLCRFYLEDLKKKLEKIKEQLKNKKQELENKKRELEKNGEKSYKPEDGNVYTDDLSIMFDRVEIEAWGSGEAGHIVNIAKSQKSRSGMPGDYIKAKLKIDPNYPRINIRVTEGGGNQENNLSDKDGGPIFIEMCNSQKQHCKPLVTVAGGGEYRTYGSKDYKDTIIHEPSLELEKTVIPTNALKSTEDNKITYIEDGEVKYETVECKSGLRSSRPGAGGCIDKSKRVYGKGSPGYVKMRPIIKGFDKKEINDAIEKVTRDLYDLEAMTDFSTKNLNVNIRETIEEKVKEELLR
ncbi:nudix hydrolase domain-containing protein [Trichonephila clavata]|uniref:Nudix hydrolase domain-containing protein n=1 Tax=Trichonephila clavata TaxID=2740835 RepID=A0A8X6H9Y4_TRICU|nr:nudix hydrolase domain-containing protein [Trichonephila clavata]